jgi:hypothetical protein
MNAKVIRRSCHPTTKIESVLTVVDANDLNNFRVNVIANYDCSVNSELTLPFDFPWKDLKVNLECACNLETCQM